MKPICYSRSVATRTAFVRQSATEHDTRAMVYLAPKKFLADVQPLFPCATCIAYEDLTKTNEVFNLADERTLLVLDRPSRYKNIATDTFVRLSRASARYQHKVLIDTVPFTAAIPYLYCPLALIDRDILGYQHWYSFRENNSEQSADGTMTQAHDVHLLARKVAPYATIDYPDFFDHAVEVIPCPLTDAERGEYQQVRDRLFAENKTASPIITTLADWTNIRPSRYDQLHALLARQEGTVAVYTNLSSHNRRLSKIIPGVRVRSFYDANGDEATFDAVVLFELPITKSYLFLDVIANLRPGCPIFFFRSDTTIDTLLYNRMTAEYQSVNAFAAALYREVHA